MITSKFIFGGKALFTVENGKGDKFTYRLYTSRKYKDSYFIESKGESVSSMTYSGYLTKKEGSTEVKYFHGRSSSKEDDKNIKVLMWAINQVINRKKFPEGYSINHQGICGCCGRDLTDAKSRQIGLGPVCNKNKKNKNHQHTSREAAILDALKKEYKEILDVYVSAGTEVKTWSTRIVFKEGDDLYFNIPYMEYSTEDTSIEYVKSQIVEYKLQLLIESI